jgi:ubiquinone/menaquinone biosynthesis C-methylase UbiE
MPPADPLQALQANHGTMLLLDRRQRDFHLFAKWGGWALGQIWVVPSPLGGAPVHVAALHAPLRTELPSFEFPKRIDCGQTTYQRLVDRFYLPVSPDPIVSAALFELIAGIYDRLVSPDVNVETARLLLEAVIPENGGAPLRILDFGCGTGFALTALGRLVRPPDGPLDLIGTDVSRGMLELATQRGERTLSIDTWRELPDNSFAAAISSFVMHYGVAVTDLERVARQLCPGARLATNYFKGDESSTHALVEQFAQFDLALERTEPLLTTPGSSNPLLVFVKR